jgi:ribosome biogenesis SPOUT family RNA methylase Rps3
MRSVRAPSFLKYTHLKGTLQHMRILAGPGAQVYFTHLSQTSNDSLTKIFEEAPNSDVLAQTLCHKIGVLDLMKQSSVPLEKVCLLDPKAEEELSPRDGDGRFSWFLFGVCLSYSVKML